MSVHAQIKYKKSVWGVVKGFIEKNTWVGLEDFFNSLLKALQSEYCIPPAKVKARRTRRGNSLLQNKQSEPTLEPHKKKDSIPLLIKARSSIVTDAKHAAKSQDKLLSWIVIILLFVLIIVNVFLYYKLRGLEGITTISVDPVIPPEYLTKIAGWNADESPPESHAEWLKILQQQEIYHAQEMQKWQTLLRTSIDMLKKIEGTLNNLQELIHSNKNR